MFSQETFCNGFVEIIATQMIVPGNCQNIYHSIKAVYNGDIQRPSAEIKHQKKLLILRIKIRSQCRRTRLIYNPFYIDTCQCTRAFCCHALFIMKICRNGYDHILDFFAKICLCILHNGADNKPGQFLRQKCLSAKIVFVICSHILFKRKCGILRMCDQTLFCNLSGHNTAILRHTDHTWRQK